MGCGRLTGRTSQVRARKCPFFFFFFFTGACWWLWRDGPQILMQCSEEWKAGWVEWTRRVLFQEAWLKSKTVVREDIGWVSVCGCCKGWLDLKHIILVRKASAQSREPSTELKEPLFHQISFSLSYFWHWVMGWVNFQGNRAGVCAWREMAITLPCLCSGWMWSKALGGTLPPHDWDSPESTVLG